MKGRGRERGSRAHGRSRLTTFAPYNLHPPPYIPNSRAYDQARLATYAPYSMAHTPIYRDYPRGATVGWAKKHPVAGPRHRELGTSHVYASNE